MRNLSRYPSRRAMIVLQGGVGMASFLVFFTALWTGNPVVVIGAIIIGLLISAVACFIGRLAGQSTLLVGPVVVSAPSLIYVVVALVASLRNSSTDSLGWLLAGGAAVLLLPMLGSSYGGVAHRRSRDDGENP